MEAAKVFKYSEKELGASVCFGFFAISWLILRLIFFPFWVINATRFALMVNDFISPHLALILLWLICSYYCHFPAMISLSSWIYQRPIIHCCTMLSIQCCWCYLCFTYTGGYLYVQWSGDSWKIEEKWEKISDLVSFSLLSYYHSTNCSVTSGICYKSVCVYVIWNGWIHIYVEPIEMKLPFYKSYLLHRGD